MAFTLDENNLNESMKLSPIYTRTLYNSSDAILFVQEKNNNENLYIFYIELKSEHIEGILKKHIFMKNLNMEILKLIYLKSRLSDKIEDILSMDQYQIEDIKKNALKEAKKYDVENISQSLVDIFNEI